MASARRARRRTVSRLRGASSLAWNGSGSAATGPLTTSSVIRMVVPSSSPAMSNRTRAFPIGHIRASRTSRCGGSTAATLVWSLMTSGHGPMLWRMRVPFAGQSSSASRMLEAPTTQDA